MWAVILEWINLILRWAHIMAGIAWIGTSFFFIFLEATLRRHGDMPDTIAGESWMVHGGGFYMMRKFKVAPDHMPEELHWFKYEAYFTLITGLLLLAVIYYFGAHAYLIDVQKADLTPFGAIAISLLSLVFGLIAYNELIRILGSRTLPLALSVFVLIAIATFFYYRVFSDRAAFLHIGAFIGTIMAASVFLTIIPNQKKVVADLLAGRKPDPKLGAEAFQRSLHNNYLTLPVIFMMISNHYPIVFAHPYAPVIALGIVLVGGLVRHYFNVTNEGHINWHAIAAVPAAIVLVLVLVGLTYWRPDRPANLAVAGGAAPVAFADAHGIVAQRCAVCHSAHPTNPDFREPPKGVMFDSPQQIAAQAANIKQQAVLSQNMPLGNLTKMTPEERQRLGAWIDQGAKVN